MLARVMVVLLAASCAFMAPLATVHAQTQAPPAAAGSKQDVARAKFQELTERMQKLMVILQKSEPEDSESLRLGLRFVQEKRLHERLTQAGTLLQQDRLDDGLSVMTEIRKDLGKLYDILQNRDLELRELLAEIERLQGLRDRVDQLAKEQTAEKEDSARIEALQQQLEQIAAQKQKAEALLQKQQSLRERTNRLGVGAADEAAKPLAEEEGGLKEDAEKLSKDIEAIEKMAADMQRRGPEPAAPKEGAGKCSSCAGQAAQAMGQAQKQLGEGKPEPSLKDQDQAIESLRKTVEELDAMAEEARRELLKLPFEQLAKKQEETQHATDTLSKDMEKSEQADENGEGKPTPGKQRVQQAVPKQRAAAGQLKEYKPAKQKQQDAKEDLEAAKEELDEALAQLRQQLSDQVLRALEERFTAMLHKQRELSAETKTIDGTRQNVLTASGELPTSLAERIVGIAAGEADLEVEASDALKLLDEDGTTAVFPPMVEQLKDDLHAVAGRCRKLETDAPVQAGQRDVEDLLELLINALRREIERREGGGQCGGGGTPPLVPISAELKVLRYLQERVNKSTLAFEGATPEHKATDAGRGESDALAKKQGRVRDLMRRLAVKLGKENHAEEEGR